jgi:hypothetical protein
MIKSKLILVLGTQSSTFCEELRLIGAVVGGRRSCGSCGWLPTPVAGLFLLIVLLTEISLISSRMGLVLRSSCRWRRSPGGTAEVHARQADRVARVDVEAEFLGHLTPASVPGRLPVGLQDAAGNRPA